MALREVRQVGDEILRKKSREVTEFDDRLHNLLDDMKDTMYEFEGVGIAAVQVGILKRVFLIEVDEVIIEFINPVILEKNGEQCGVEGCLSVEGENGFVERPEYVKVEAYDRFGKKFVYEGREFAAIVISHEYDHLEGELFIDKVLSDEELLERGYELKQEGEEE